MTNSSPFFCAKKKGAESRASVGPVSPATDLTYAAPGGWPTLSDLGIADPAALAGGDRFEEDAHVERLSEAPDEEDVQSRREGREENERRDRGSEDQPDDDTQRSVADRRD